MLLEICIGALRSGNFYNVVTSYVDTQRYYGPECLVVLRIFSVENAGMLQPCPAVKCAQIGAYDDTKRCVFIVFEFVRTRMVTSMCEHEYIAAHAHVCMCMCLCL